MNDLLTYHLVSESPKIHHHHHFLGGALNAEGEEGLFNEEPLQTPQVENGMDYGVSVEELGNNTKDYKDGLKINRRLRNHCKGQVSPTMTSKKRPPAYCYMIFF